MILVIQGQLPHYRREFLNALCVLDSVTVVHSGSANKGASDRFDEVILPVRKLGPFSLQIGLHRLISQLQPKTIIAMFDVRWLNSVAAMYRFDRSANWVWWGLDEGKSKLALRAKLAIAHRRNPIVFYNIATYDALKTRISEKKKLFIANNTFHVANRIEGHSHPTKKSFINVGSLDARKQNDVTIRALQRIYQDIETEIGFTLIGSGSEEQNLTELIEELNLQDRVQLVGHIEDPKELATYYAEALASVSFGQAGLAVLQSMAFGVPFVTKGNAITGGEKNNIIDGVNGILCDDDPEALETVLRKLIQHPEYARDLGKNAYDYYSNEATVENMCANFEKAINYAESQDA